MHLSSMSAEIYDFVLANRVNVNKIIIFSTTILCSLKAPLKALIRFGRCYVPSTDSLSCSELKSVRTVLMRQLQANSWKYMCLRTMDCLHHVTATWKVLTGLRMKNSFKYCTCYVIFMYKMLSIRSISAAGRTSGE